MTEEQCLSFANNWINAWNSHNIDVILEHYADNIKFYSPFILLLKFNEEGVLEGRDKLKEYFLKGLNAYPNLYFQIHNVFVGVNTLVIYYTSVGNRKAAEVFELDGDGKAVKVLCNYSG